MLVRIMNLDKDHFLLVVFFGIENAISLPSGRLQFPIDMAHTDLAVKKHPMTNKAISDFL